MNDYFCKYVVNYEIIQDVKYVMKQSYSAWFNMHRVYITCVPAQEGGDSSFLPWSLVVY